MSFDQIVQVFESDGRLALEGFGAGHFTALADGDRERVFGLAAARLPAGQYDEVAMQALGKLELPQARDLLERKLAEAPNGVCRAIALGALFDATRERAHEAALIELLGAPEPNTREKALTYLTRIEDDSSAVLDAFERRLVEEDQAGLRTRLADEVIYRSGLVPRGRVDRNLVVWEERLASADAGERRRALAELQAAKKA